MIKTAVSASAATPSRCTAFDGTRRLATGSFVDVALAVRAHLQARPSASVLIFDDQSGRQIDFDLRGTESDIAARLGGQTSALSTSRSTGRPKLGVVAREVTLLPRHWNWLSAQPGGASATLRKLVEAAARSAPDDKAVLRAIQERTYNFMSAMAGNLPRFEEASRALFANRIAELEAIIAAWPADIGQHVMRLYEMENAPAP